MLNGPRKPALTPQKAAINMRKKGVRHPVLIGAVIGCRSEWKTLDYFLLPKGDADDSYIVALYAALELYGCDFPNFHPDPSPRRKTQLSPVPGILFRPFATGGTTC